MLILHTFLGEIQSSQFYSPLTKNYARVELCDMQKQGLKANKASCISSEPRPFFFINIGIVELHNCIISTSILLPIWSLMYEQTPCATENVQLLVEHGSHHDTSYMLA